MKKKILITFGTRPEAIKLAKLIFSLKKKFKIKVCVSGQHNEMLHQVLNLFKIKPDFDLKVMKSNQSLNLLSSKILERINSVLTSFNPNMVLVHGDTTTAFISSLAAFQNKIKIGHIEAGLRTHNLNYPYPEEFNRKGIAVIADINFTPTKNATKNLIKENISKKKIIQTGNTIVDTLKFARKILFADKKKIKKIQKKFWFINKNKKLIIVTCHRRENYGKGIDVVCQSLLEIVKKNNNVQIIFPVHMNPNIRKKVYKKLNKIKNIYLVKPLDYFSFIYLMEISYLILTDSGGIQEEAPSFKKPVLILRNETERPEVESFGGAILVGTNKSKIINNITKLLINENLYKKMSNINNPYGDGKAATRIVNYLTKNLK